MSATVKPTVVELRVPVKPPDPLYLAAARPGSPCFSNVWISLL
jgi:hypothetical protein